MSRGRRGAADGERAEVDETVPGRDEPRHVVQPVDVDAEPSGERVLHEARERDDDRDLRARSRVLAPQQSEQQQPGAGAEQPLRAERGDGVEPEHQRYPDEDDRGREHVSRARRA